MEKLPKLVKTSIKDVKHSEIVFSEIVSQFFFLEMPEASRIVSKVPKITENFSKLVKSH